MKQELIANLKRVNWEFEESEDKVIIKDVFNLHIIVSFKENSYVIGSQLKVWNDLTSIFEMTLEKATRVNYWGYVLVSLLIAIESALISSLGAFWTGLFFLLIITCIVTAILNMIYWIRYSMITSKVETWLNLRNMQRAQ